MNKVVISKALIIGSYTVSVLFHPLFLPAFGLLILLNAPTFLIHLPASLKRVLLLLTIINTAIVPLAILPFLKYRKFINSFQMEKRQERVLPLAFGSLMYVATTVIFFSYDIPQIIKSFMLAASITSFIVLIFTFWWKISVHAAGVGSLLATVIIMSVRMMTNLSLIWMPLLLFCGLLLSARLYLKIHNSAQIYAGFALGFLTVFTVMMLY